MSNTENRIDKKFAELRAEGKKAFIPFITAGDPDIETTKKLVKRLADCGADLIELGIPFSDPVAEGPVIQEASIRALAGGANLDIISDAVVEIRKSVDIPLLYMMYFNSMLAYGLDKFFKKCAEIGIDGVIVPDLPYEESGEIAEYTEKYGVHQILLVSPTSEESRLENIARDAKGFIYCVSSMGVTGMRSSFSDKIAYMTSTIERVSDIPKCIGFGISRPEHIKQLEGAADGLIVGSAIVNAAAKKETPAEKIEAAAALATELKQAF